MTRYGGTAALALLAAAPACAAPGDFLSCDGYGAPNEHGDGMTRAATGFLGLFRPEPLRGDTTRTNTAIGGAGVASCDTALADPALAPNYALRRASLLRARAIHRLGNGDFDAALGDLDRADAAGKASGEQLFDRSLGVGIGLFRAYALADRGKSAEAAALADTLRRVRPYGYGVVRATALIALKATGDWAAFRRAMAEAATVHPQALPTVFLLEFDDGDFAAAHATRGRIALTLPRATPGYTVDQGGAAEAELFADEARLDAVDSFALAALGRDAEADALIAALRTRIADASGPLPLRADGHLPTRLDRDRHEMLTYRLSAARKIADEAERLIHLLRVARTGDADKLLAEAGPQRLPPDITGVTILTALARAAPAARRTEIAQVADALAARARGAREQPPLTLEALYDAVPEAETASRIPQYKNAKNIIGENTGNGFLVRTDGARVTIDFGGVSTSSAVVEEMALLRAADLARATGRKGLIVLSRRTYKRTLTTYSLYSGRNGATTPMGYSAEITVAFVDPGALPAAFAGQAARVVDPGPVYAALAPVYLSAAP